MTPATAATPTPQAPRLTLAEALASARETRALLVGAGAVHETAHVFATHFPGARAVIVADQTTLPLAGRRRMRATT